VVDARETFVAFCDAFGGWDCLCAGASAAVRDGEDVLVEERGEVIWECFVAPALKSS
jgi:hypothetical protein